MNFQEFIIVYLIGGVTFLPILVYIIYTIATTIPAANIKATALKKSKSYLQNSEKSGWVKLTNNAKTKDPESNVGALMSGIQSYVQGAKRQKGLVYAQLKCNALFIYESNPDDQEQQIECKLIIPVHNYNISLYPEKTDEQDIFGKATSIRLSLKKHLSTVDGTSVVYDHNDGFPLISVTNELYMNCSRPIDKEDWYFGLLAATDMMAESPDIAHVEMMDKTHFDSTAIETLISVIHQDEDQRQTQWLNAILGRIFLGLYKTDEIKEYLQVKILKKVKNVKLPNFLGEIAVQSIDIGNSIPILTQPRLVSLSSEGDLLAESTMDYNGGLRVVIQTDFNFTYSSLMKPIRVPLVLSVTLKSMAGKLLLKVKPPPTNRCWVAFYQMPQMEWEITPIVSDKQIRFSMVTNAIQSKIREVIAENIVLPNMDDFPFFSSKGKGGVFGSRVPKPSSQYTTSSRQTNSEQNYLDSHVSTTDDGANKSVDTGEIYDESSNALLKPHSLSACGTESIKEDKPEITNCRVNNNVLTPIRLSPGIHHLRARGYSSPELSESSQNEPLSSLLSNELNKETVLCSDSSSFSSSHTDSRFSTRIGLTKRQFSSSSRKSLNATSTTEEQLQRTHSYHDSESKLQIDDQEPTIFSMSSYFSENDIYAYEKNTINSKRRGASEQQYISTPSSSSSSYSTSTTTTPTTTTSIKSTTTGNGKTALFFKFGNNNNSKQNEKKSDGRKSIFLNTKKDEFYSIANTFFKKTKPASKDIKKEKNRSEQTQSKISSFPPPLPPRSNPVHYTTLVGPDNSLLSDENLSTKTFSSEAYSLVSQTHSQSHSHTNGHSHTNNRSKMKDTDSNILKPLIITTSSSFA